MLSRVADSIYWMNRYIERVDNYARFLDVNFNLSLDMPDEISTQWGPLVVTTGDWHLYEEMYKNTLKSDVIHFLAFNENNQNSIYSCILNARENAKAVRPEITREVWEQINALYYLAKEGQKKKLWLNKDPRAYFDEIKNGCQLYYGIVDTTISRNEAWHFAKIGQLLERADKTSRIIDVKYHILLPSVKEIGTPIDLIHWSALLKSVSAYDMYRKKYGKLNPFHIMEFLILDKNFPRSIHSCLIQTEKSLHTISGNNGSYTNEAEKKLGRLRSKLEYQDINEISQEGIHEYLDTFQNSLNEVASEIYDTFFNYSNPE